MEVITGDELATKLAALQGGCLFVSHPKEWNEKDAFLPKGSKVCNIPLVVAGTATRRQYEAQIRTARKLSGDNTLSYNRHHAYFYRVEAAD